MKFSRVLRTICVTWTTSVLLLQGSVLRAGTPTSMLSIQRPCLPTVDVALAAGGRLQGLVVDVQGVPVSGASIMVRPLQGDGSVLASDRLGQFSVQGLRGGTYQLLVGRQTVIVRAWTAEAAPPQAKPMVLIVVNDPNDPVVRGQMPLQAFFASDAFVVTGLVAAMIAIPVVSHNSAHGQPHSP